MVFLHIQSGYLYTIKLFQVNIYTFDHILIFTKTLAEKPPPTFFSIFGTKLVPKV